MHAFSYNTKKIQKGRTLNNKSQRGYEIKEKITNKINTPLPKRKGKTLLNTSIFGTESYDKTIDYVKKIGEE
jgi:hypothetical protein